MSPASLLSTVLVAAASVRLAAAASAQVFSPPSKGPLVQTANYTSFSNTTLHDHKVVKGKVFDRIIQVWLENTDFDVAGSTPIFESLSSQGITFTNYHGVTHPSEPNYIASVGGDFFGMADDNMYHIPSNISCVVDLLEDRGISWATYQENMPGVGYYGYGYTQANYINSSAAAYTYYYRKHNPLMIYDSVALNAERVKRVRTFNDFANDVVNGTLPQWTFITPNMVNDAHDTTIDFAADFLEYWLLPLLTDPRVNGERTLILLTFDENETYGIQNTVYTIALGTAIPVNLRGTIDDTVYTHYSMLSTVQNNWSLKSLGRQDTNASIASVFDFVAKKTGHKNTPVAANKVPHFNLTGVAGGPLTSAHYVPFSAPNILAKGAGSGGVHLNKGIDLRLTEAKLPAPVNVTAHNTTTPWQMSPETTSGKKVIPCAEAKCP
ncbi:phosphoesterase family-domain-containing protein [Roridomyces roridus]|uniref:Phosphoesterase family-domain-containing protein n=1 Tax=Roridomyces roridus TaxID=1738132 RepID=A0AAD7BCI8_9AGAR|nr:phosphoesterase family-domain-containing protein [Roridomyces roridus]